ncbi:MAG: condensation domain-containing protein, partial [Psychrosphaera sp.]|nr:condensation domain-containing protein [Psychrosphaera sp.]
GGAGVSPGYLNRPDLTSEVFIENVFATDKDIELGYTRLYKTGDIVRRAPNGDLIYMGRSDFQIKIRGFRIELEEIQSALTDLAQVNQAVVVDFLQAKNLYLAAYVVLEPGQEATVSQLRAELSAQLAEYMVPSSFYFIDSVPLTVNGKVDKRALPKPELLLTDGYVEPRDALEQQLCGIWQTVLGLKQVGVEDNFFRVGGNSVIAIRLTAMIAREMNLDVSLALLFEQPNISRLASHIRDNDFSHDKRIIPHVEHAHYPLSFAQERLLFIESFEQGSDAYHIPYLVQLDQADMAVLQAAFDTVIERHPVLKTVYLNTANEGNYQEVLSDKVMINTKRPDSQEQFLRKIKAHIKKAFDLSSQPSVKLFHYITVDENEYLLMLFHHIAFDGWSINIFMAELADAYHGLSQNREPILPELEISYGDYAQWQREYLQGENLEKLLSYWKQQLGDFEALALTADHPRPAIPNYRGKDSTFVLDEGLSTQLRELAKTHETSLYTVMLSSFYVTLAAMSGQKDVVIGTPSDNRHHFQTQSLVGFFVNSLALRAKVDSNLSIEALVKQVHLIITQGKAHEELPFEKLVEVLRVERDTSRHPIYQVMFSVQSFLEGSDTSDAMAKLPFIHSDMLTEQRLYNPAKFDLSLYINDGKSCIEGMFNYAVSLFDEATINRLSCVYQRVLRAFVDVDSQSLTIGQIELLSDEERQSSLNDWQPVDAAQTEKTFAQMFEAQVEKTPNAVALIFADERLTYQQLNEKANQLAHVIREAYFAQHETLMGPDTLIAMYLFRSMETVISILAILKAGGAYVPIAVDFPQPRVTFILEDTQAPLVLSAGPYSEALNKCIDAATTAPLVILTDDPKLTEKSTPTNPCPICT